MLIGSADPICVAEAIDSTPAMIAFLTHLTHHCEISPKHIQVYSVIIYQIFTIYQNYSNIINKTVQYRKYSLTNDTLDQIDLHILRELQADSSLSNVELARRVDLSAPATHTRVKRLEQLGFIKQYTAILDYEKLGYDMLCFIFVSLQMHQPKEVEFFRAAMLDLPEVLECHFITGAYDYIVKVAIRGRQDLQHFLMDHLTSIPAVAQIHTHIVLDEVKATTALPLE